MKTELTEVSDIAYSKKQELTFVVKGSPVPQGRPIFSRKTGTARDPDKSKKAKQIAKAIAEKEATANKFIKCNREMPVRITIQAFRKPNSTKAKWWKFACVNGWIAPTTKRGDADNILKLLFDAFNGTLYEDDAQIFSVHYECRYAEKERTEIKVEGFYVNSGEVREMTERIMPKTIKKKSISLQDESQKVDMLFLNT